VSKRNVLQEKFINNEIQTKQYWDDVKKLGKVWDTKEWEHNRKAKLKDCCERCGSKEKLTIQHTWHPRNYKEAKFAVMADMIGKERSPERKFSERETCPACNHTSVRYRKTMGNWKCFSPPKWHLIPEKKESMKRYCDWTKTSFEEVPFWKYHKKRKCDHVFDEPVVKLLESNKFKTDYNKLKWQFMACFNLFDGPVPGWAKTYKHFSGAPCKSEPEKKEKWEELSRRATLLTIKDTDRYIEMREGDYITACGKCAFEMDKQLIDLKYGDENE